MAKKRKGFNMKSLFSEVLRAVFIIAVFLCVVVFFSNLFCGCEAKAEYQAKDAALMWEYPRDYDQGVTHFVLYAWNGDDTTLFAINQMDSIGVYPFDLVASPDTMEFRPFPFTNAFARGGIEAVDSTGLRSGRSLSPYAAYWELYGPDAPIMLKITK